MTFTEKTIEEFRKLSNYTNGGCSPKDLDDVVPISEKVVLDFITAALAKQKEEILKALPEEKKEETDFNCFDASVEACYAYNLALSLVREAIEKI